MFPHINNISAASKRGRMMDELVSRQAVLVALNDALMAWSYMPEWRDEKILEAIAELPTIHLERKGCEEREQGKCPWYAG